MAGNDRKGAGRPWTAFKKLATRGSGDSRLSDALRHLLVLRLAAGHSFGPSRPDKTLWHGFGIITALIAIAYLIWEIARALDYKVNLGQVTPGMTSAGFAVALLVFTVIMFLDWSDFRHWPAWIGLSCRS